MKAEKFWFPFLSWFDLRVVMSRCCLLLFFLFFAFSFVAGARTGLVE
jgi:hypothetical protein